MVTDPISDMIAMINNANAKYHEKVDIPASKIKENISKLLKNEGYISSYKKIDDHKQGLLRIYLKYANNKEKCITSIKRVSKPGLRVYRKFDELPWVFRGLGISIISTPKGIMSDKEARKKHLGGEVLCAIW